MKRKIVSFFCCFALVVALTACGEDVTLSNFETDSEISSISDDLTVENDLYRLEWNSNNNGVNIVELQTGEKWGTTPESANGEQFDEFGMPIKKHPQVESVLLLKYLNLETNTEETLNSYTDAVGMGRVSCTEIDNGLRVEFYFDEAEFMIPVEYRLREDSVNISVDTEKIQEGSNQLLQISLAPFFCSAENDTDGSYLFVPSGSGALVATDTVAGTNQIYSASVYGEDLSIEKEALISTTESVRLPVYGAYSNGKASFAVIEEGADSAEITVNAGSQALGYSAVYATFRMRGFTDHTAELYSSIKVQNVIYSKSMINTRLSVSFYPLSGEKAGYSGMAAAYRNYLVEKCGMPASSDRERLNLTLIGGSMITKSFLGIPYQSIYASTTVSQAKDIISDLCEKIEYGDFSVKLKGFGQSGIDEGKVGGGFALNKDLGSKKELKQLMEVCNHHDIDLYMDFDVIRYQSSGGGFSVSFDPAINAGEQKAAQYHYNIAVKKPLKDTLYYLLSPSKITKAVDKLIEKNKKLNFPGVSLDTLSSVSYSDYADKNSSDFYAKSKMADTAMQAIEKVKSNGIRFSAGSANMYAAVNADIITEAPTVSSKEYVFYADVPFYEMVFGGAVPMACESINLSSDPQKQILRAVESGTGLNYTVMNCWDNSLIDANFPLFYTGVYDYIQDDIVNAVNGLAEYYDKIGNAHIKTHSITESGLRETVFDNGTVVYVNYGNDPLLTPNGQEVAAMGYLISEELL